VRSTRHPQRLAGCNDSLYHRDSDARFRIRFGQDPWNAREELNLNQGMESQRLWRECAVFTKGQLERAFDGYSAYLRRIESGLREDGRSAQHPPDNVEPAGDKVSAIVLATNRSEFGLARRIKSDLREEVPHLKWIDQASITRGDEVAAVDACAGVRANPSGDTMCGARKLGVNIEEPFPEVYTFHDSRLWYNAQVQVQASQIIASEASIPRSLVNCNER
jgi:hypothetical protein